MTTFGERRSINPEQHKEQTKRRLDAIFGTFEEFSALIGKKNICDLPLYAPSPKPQIVSPPQIVHHAPTVISSSNAAASTSAATASAAAPKKEDEKQMTTEELLQSMQSLVGMKEPMASLSKPREPSSSSSSSSSAVSSRGNPSSSASTTHRTNGTSSSGSSRRDRDREKDRERDRERERDRDSKDSRERRPRDSERDRRTSKAHRADDRPRHRDEHRCSSVASTSTAVTTNRSSKEKEEPPSAESAPSKNIDSLFVPNTSTTTVKRSYRESPHRDLFGDDEAKDVKRKRKKTSDEAKWPTAGNDEFHSPDSGISVGRGDSDDAAVIEEVVAAPAAVTAAAFAPQEDAKTEIDMPVDEILKMMTSLIGPLQPISLPYKSLGELQNAIRPPPPVLQPMKPLPQATNRATSPMAPPKRPLAAISPMRPFRNPVVAASSVKTPSPSSQCRSTKISLNLSVLSSSALQRLKKEHAKVSSGRSSRQSPPPQLERETSQPPKRSTERKRRRISPSLSPRSMEKSPWKRPSRSPQTEKAKKQKAPQKTSSNTLEVPQSSSKLPSRLDIRTPPPRVSRRSKPVNLSEVFGPNCCAPQLRPRTPLLPDIDISDSSMAYQTIISAGTQLKHRADNWNKQKRLGKQLLYFEASVYFMYGCSYLIPTDNLGTHNKLCQTITFLKSMQKQSSKSILSHEYDRHFVSRFSTLVRRSQSVLAYHLYDAMSDANNKRFDLLQKLEPKRPVLPSDPNLTGNENMQFMCNQTIQVDAQLYWLQSQQLKGFTHIYWAHKMWKDVNASLSPVDKAMLNETDRICGPLHVGSSLLECAEYMYTALTWLKDEYEQGTCQSSASPHLG